jgi:hypothetical protein
MEKANQRGDMLGINSGCLCFLLGGVISRGFFVFTQPMKTFSSLLGNVGSEGIQLYLGLSLSVSITL